MAENLQLYSISENELEKCLKCSICTVYCPVAGVTPFYPGPKHAGPDGERYRIKDASFFDEKALKMCLNCKRCEVACPEGVHIADIIQSARIKYSKHKPGLREFTLANTDLVGSITTLAAPVANFATSFSPVKATLDTIVKIDKHRTFPAYASQKFETWYKKHAAAEQDKYEKQVSYFHGCYVNYNYPQLGKDLIKVMNAIGYGVKLLDKEKCCGVPLVSNGFATQAKKHGEINMASMRKSVAEGRPILTTGTSCTLMMRNEYDHLLHIDNKVAQEHLLLATRFIYKLVEEGKVKLAFREDYKKRVCYHTACHMERLGWTIYSTSLVKMIPGIDFVMLDSMCCGIAGTYGFKKENYPISQKIGEPLFKQIEEAKGDNVITDCETCKWQIEMSTSAKVLNPISVLAEAIDYEKTKALNQ
ncbi:MAG TPA: anaerobic glycerol-3-phosphate dehydrogenase subunit C [Prevotellaceae bacterium]|jgi:glycerol-3-phosphate dehydrogenase subunit C|nr:anaerobic glycerol-3-phosphate dehydrogenase subunit C [Prevotellaceae bacterium]